MNCFELVFRINFVFIFFQIIQNNNFVDTLCFSCNKDKESNIETEQNIVFNTFINRVHSNIVGIHDQNGITSNLTDYNLPTNMKPLIISSSLRNRTISFDIRNIHKDDHTTSSTHISLLKFILPKKAHIQYPKRNYFDMTLLSSTNEPITSFRIFPTNVDGPISINNISSIPFSHIYFIQFHYGQSNEQQFNENDEFLLKITLENEIPSNFSQNQRIKRSNYDGDCHLRHARFDSKEFKKYLNIIEPTYLSIGYCFGICNDYANIKYVHTSLMVMLSLNNTNEVTGSYKLCCSPYETTPITVKHLVNGLVTKTIINGFSATSCICH